MVLFGQSGCIWAKFLYSGKVVVIGQSDSIRANEVVFVPKCFYSGKSCFFHEKCLYSGKSC